ncbi:DUF427 domain-containing protein [Mesorhizobium sp. ArgA1]
MVEPDPFAAHFVSMRLNQERQDSQEIEMEPIAASSDHQNFIIEPFVGTVTVRFSDAIVAATDRAKVLKEDGKEPVFYVPFEDIYFDLLEKTNTVKNFPLKGTAAFWRVHAVGSAADDFMWAFETPEVSALAIAGHGAFDAQKSRIDAEPAQDKRHTPHVLE